MRLSLRATQRVVMTPLLQQAIQLLQLSTLELEQVVRKELEENPLREERPEEKQEVDGEAATATAADGTELAPAPAPTEPASKETSSVDGERADDLPFDLTSAVFDQQDERTPVSTEEREDLPFENLGRTATSLAEHLEEQLRLATDDPRIVAIGEAIIGNLDEAGYLRQGVPKRSLDRIMESVEEIQGLEPKPGRRFSPSEQRYIAPDVSIHKVGDDYVVVLNEEGIPRLRVNALYRSLLRRSGDEARQYVEQKLRSAVWLIKSVEQRQRTLRKVTQSLVKFQRDFLDRGVAHLRPLALRHVGEDNVRPACTN